MLGTALKFALRYGKGHALKSQMAIAAGAQAVADSLAVPSLGDSQASWRARQRRAINSSLGCAGLHGGRRMESRPKSFSLRLCPMRPGIPLLSETMPGRRKHGNRTFADGCKAKVWGGNRDRRENGAMGGIAKRRNN